MRASACQADRPVGVLEIGCDGAGAEVDPWPQHTMAHEAVMALVVVAEEYGGGDLAVNPALRTERAAADEPPQDPRARTGVHRALESCAVPYLDAFLQHDGAVPHVEDDPRLDRRASGDHALRVHRAPGSLRHAESRRGEEIGAVGSEKHLERGDEIVRSSERQSLDVELRPGRVGPCQVSRGPESRRRWRHGG